MTDSDGVREKLERAIHAAYRHGYGKGGADEDGIPWRPDASADEYLSNLPAIVSEALALLDGEPSERIFTWEDLEKANTAVIRAMNREPDLRSSLVGQLQISMEAMGLRVVISPPLECVEAYKRDAGIPTENGEDDAEHENE